MKIENLKLKIIPHYLLIVFLILYFLIISYKLVSNPTPFYDWDESINVQVAKETVENFSLVPLWQEKAWLDKPPLPFLFFGIILKLIPFTRPEISLRIISLLLSLLALTFIYAVFCKATNETAAVLPSLRSSSTAAVKRIMATLTVIITAFTPIFLQRSQIVNLDVFLLIGWLGYLLFIQNFWLSLFFLSIAVLTKSLIGFYPALILLIFYTIILQVSRFKPKRLRIRQLAEGKPLWLIKTVLIHISILLLWYLVMLIFFGKDFWQQHIIETHFRRVTASIESHFGQRTYYIDLLREQLGIFFWLSLSGLVFVISNVVRNLAKRNNYQWILYSLFLFPLFIFLNLTKTKIFWYLYPVIPQFAFLSVYHLTIIKNKKIILYLVSCILIFVVIYNNFIKTNFFTTFYSKPEDYYHLSLFAKNKCDSLSVLVGKETREATKTLENLGLTISSTRQWGDHPSIVYYFGKKVYFFYDKDLFSKNLSLISCFAFRNDDTDIFARQENLKPLQVFNSYYLFKQ